MRLGARKLGAAAVAVVAVAVLVTTAVVGTTTQLVVVATLLVLAAAMVTSWMIVAAERRITAAVRNAAPTVQEHVRRIEVVQPEAHVEQLLRVLHANTARLEAGQQDLGERIDRLRTAGGDDAAAKPATPPGGWPGRDSPE